MKDAHKVALLLGSDPSMDKDAIGPYTVQLYRHMILELEESPEPDLDVDLVPFHPRSAREWVRSFTDVFRNYDLVHIEYPFEGWGTSVAPGLLPGLLRSISPYSKTKLVTTLHEWRIMHPLRKASILPLVWRSHGTLFVSNREREAFVNGPCYRLRARKPLTDVIPLGVIISIPELNSEELLYTRSQLLNWNGVGVDVLLGYFGFIYAAKQPDKMLHTLKTLLKQDIRARLVLAGDFMADHVEEKKGFLKEVESLGLKNHVLLLGFIKDEDELARILSACNAVLLLFSDGVSARRTSFWTVLELGAPVVTTRPSFRDEFRDLLRSEHTECIEFVDVDVAPHDLATVTKRFGEFRLPEQRIGSSPSPQDMAGEHLSFYRRLLYRV